MPAHPFYTVAFPDIAAAQRQWIQEVRREHDPNFGVVDPHFTLVFSVRDMDEAAYLGHIGSIARGARPIRFHCRHAMLGADDIDGTAHVYLVPSEGHAEIYLLHEALYRGLLQPHHRLEIPYIPHIGVAATKDFQQAKRLCDRLNAGGIAVEGTLVALTAGVLRDGRLKGMASFALGGGRA